jgi:hypothetical protein
MKKNGGASAALIPAACGGWRRDASRGGVYADCATSPSARNSAPADQLQQGGTITVASEKNIDDRNAISSEGNVDWMCTAADPNAVPGADAGRGAERHRNVRSSLDGIS